MNKHRWGLAAGCDVLTDVLIVVLLRERIISPYGLVAQNHGV